jgi:phosphoribosylformylglycinamidine synthase subunit PurL
MSSLTSEEIDYLKNKLRRYPNETELNIVSAEWSEHCSYKSSKKYLKLLPTNGRRVLVGPGYDAGILDIGDGFIITVHIESHNHPSAVEPYGGAATGVGGVLRDIIAMGTRPIALLNALRFSPITKTNDKYSKSKWLFRNVVRGIADYGNCIGVPTVGGDVEFDPSFEDYCLVDVASIGVGRKDRIITNSAKINDLVVLAGGSTGRDGIHGASFASKTLEEENRSAIQIPDPFLEKLLMEATIEASEQGCIKAIKDLGGGGLACCLSETSDNLKRGFDIELASIHTKHKNMLPVEFIISESQERMMYIIDESKIGTLKEIFDKYEINYAVIGRVRKHHNLVIRNNGKLVAHMPSNLIANPPIVLRNSKSPDYQKELRKKIIRPNIPNDLNKALLSMMSNPSIAEKSWVYHQFDHEVGLRTVLKPGLGDASVLKITSGKFISAKLDGNSKHCFLDPYQGTLGCLSEVRRNVISTGAEPIGVIDHLQFGSPEDPEVFWTFTQAINAISSFCRFMKTPVVGGKVSFYNETTRGAIKPSPVVGMIGLIEKESLIMQCGLKPGNFIFIVGSTLDEMGASECYEYYHSIIGGNVPKLTLRIDKLNGQVVLKLIRKHLLDCVHDCSKGGLAVALSEMAIQNRTGIVINLDSIPNSCSRIDNLLFSESHSRYIVGTSKPDDVEKYLANINGIDFAHIGYVTGNNDNRVRFIRKKDKEIVKVSIKNLTESYCVLERIMNNTQHLRDKMNNEE